MDHQQGISRKKYESILQGLKLEVDDRVKKLRQKSQLLSASLRLRLDLEVTRYPADIRQMKVRDFLSRLRSQCNVNKDHNKLPIPKDLSSNNNPGSIKTIEEISLQENRCQNSISHDLLLLNTPKSNLMRPSSVIVLPVSVSKKNLLHPSTTRSNPNTKQREIKLELDFANSPATATDNISELDHLDSPAKREVEQHLLRLQQRLQLMMNKVKSTTTTTTTK